MRSASRHRRAAAADERTPRMQPLARLPVFLDLDGKRALVAGNGGAGGLEGGASVGGRRRRVDVFADASLRRAARAGCGTAARPSSSMRERGWRAGDFAGAAVAVGAFDDDAKRQTIRRRRARGRRAGQRHRQAGVLRFLLRRDRQPFAAGDRHLHRRRGAGIRPGDPRQARGDDPARLCALGRSRARAGAGGAIGRAVVRRAAAVLAAIYGSCAIEPSDARAGAKRFRRLLATATGLERAEPGSVTLVGAGPGDPELLTLRAVRALQSADIILIDDLVSPDILDFARREAKKMMVGKTGYVPSCEQDEINALMVALAKGGKRVVRLKGGDRHDLRPRRRGDRGVPRGGDRCRDRPRHQRGAGRGCARFACAYS